MQVSTANKPVMDVAAPQAPIQSINARPTAVTPNTPLVRPAELPVRPAPFAPAAASAIPKPASITAPVPLPAHRPISKKTAAIAEPAPRTPVALITVTVFVMLVLSILAVTVYMTSQTA